jgi:quercetin dioxygenase-like cupin family protein
MALKDVHAADHQAGEPTIYSLSRRAAKALAGLVLAAGVVFAAATLGGTASAGEGASEKQIFSGKLPNVPGKALTVVQVDYRPGGFSVPHRHPASGFVFAYVISGTVRSQVEGEPLREYTAGETWTEPPNAHHIVSANASKTEPARVMAYVIADDGVQATVYDK